MVNHGIQIYGGERLSQNLLEDISNTIGRWIQFGVQIRLKVRKKHQMPSKRDHSASWDGKLEPDSCAVAKS